MPDLFAGFQVADLVTIGLLVALEGLLSADNAMVLAVLVLGLSRRSRELRYAGLALFGLTLAKIFLFDLAELSSLARAASFVAVGGLLLVGGLLVQRLGEREADILER